MRAAMYERFNGPIEVRDIAAPLCPTRGVVIEVAASGLCRSDWHGWQGHDPDVPLPNVPGHELAGTVVEVGAAVREWTVGARVTVPFVCACGECGPCRRGDRQVCEHQQQPGFTRHGSFAEHVAIDRADINLVALPDSVDFDTAAGLGCRFATAYRAVVHVARVQEGETVAVHGCGGVGLAVVMIARSRGARVVAIDPASGSRSLAESVGAHETRGDALELRDMVVSFDAFGAAGTMRASIACLRPRGRHVQVGLLGADASPSTPMGSVVAKELQILGSHGMAAQAYPQMLAEIASGRLEPQALVRDTVGLHEGVRRLSTLGEPGTGTGGVTVVHPHR